MPERKILDGVSFVVPAGKSVAIVGTSGSGKASDIPCFFIFSAHVPYPGNVIRKQLKVPTLMHHRLLLYPGDVGFHFTVLTWEISTCTGTLSFHHLVSSSLHHQMIFCAAPLILNFDLLAGKSTILRLMFRFFDTHSGNVRSATI